MSNTLGCILSLELFFDKKPNKKGEKLCMKLKKAEKLLAKP